MDEPDLEDPDLEDLEELDLEEPDLEDSDLEDPDLEDLEEPDLEDPDLEDPDRELEDEKDFFDTASAMVQRSILLFLKKAEPLEVGRAARSWRATNLGSSKEALELLR